MKFKDNINFCGYFSVKSYKKDGSVEVYEDKNLIMDKARSNMAELIGGYSEGAIIDKFSLGNKGHIDIDILNNKKVGVDGEFVSTRTMLFSEDPTYTDENNQDNFVYEITFDVTSNTLSQTDTNAIGKIKGTEEEAICEVNRLISDRTCTYTITIPGEAGNAVGENSVIGYTEAALYAGEDIFSMKTFPARVKEDTVKFVITWAIIF